MLTPEPISIH